MGSVLGSRRNGFLNTDGGFRVSGISAYETEEAGSGREDFWPIVAIKGAKMRQKSRRLKESAEQVVKAIRRATRRFSAEEKIRIVLSGLRGEDSIAELCRREGIVHRLMEALELFSKKVLPHIRDI
jgi:hypothetical protein